MSVTPQPVPQSSDTHTAKPCPSSSLGPTLEPAIRKACDERLSPIEWFRSDWQRGGGSTGFAELRLPTGEPVRVVVKIPVGPNELRWSVALGRKPGADEPAGHDCPTPRVFAAGSALNGYDLGWIVMERLDGKPLAANFSAHAVTEVLRACAHWQARAEAVAKPGSPPPIPDWAKTIEHSREVARRGSIPEAQRWNNHLHDVARALPTILKRWGARTINTWCHGDLHPGNAMHRAPPPHNGHADAPCVLLDLALVHAGHWVEDALYLERVYWGHPDHLHGVNPVSTLAAFRRELGLEASDNYGLLASVRRVLTAAGAPALLEREGNKRYLAHALDVIHRLLPMVAH